MDHVADFIKARKRNFNLLKAGLKPLEEFFILPEATPNSDPSWFGFALTLRDDVPFTRDELVIHLNEKRIGTRLMFGGNLLRQPYMLCRNYRVVGELPNSDKTTRDSFWLGVYPGLSPEAVGYMVDTIRDFCKAR